MCGTGGICGLCTRCCRRRHERKQKEAWEYEERQKRARLGVGKDVFGILEPRYVLFWKQVVAEFIGALVYTMVNVLIYVEMDKIHSSVVCVYTISFCNACVMGALVMLLGPVSGGFCNPAVNVGMWLAGKVKCVKFVAYLIVHFSGAYTGVYLVWLILRDVENLEWHKYGSLAMYKSDFFLLGNDILEFTALKIEMMMSLALVLVYAGGDHYYIKNTINGAAHTAMGVFSCVCACHFICFALTGCAMNPARIYASNYFADVYDYSWVYMCGPIFGAAFAGVYHRIGIAAYRTDYSKYI